MSSGSKSKAQGTTEQRRQRKLLQAPNYEGVVWAEEGVNDKGDLYLTIGGWSVTIESKDAGALNSHGIVEKANRKAPGNAVLWWKRKERKEGAKRRTQVGKPIVCMTEELFMELLGYVKMAKGVMVHPDHPGCPPYGSHDKSCIEYIPSSGEILGMDQ